MLNASDRRIFLVNMLESAYFRERSRSFPRNLEGASYISALAESVSSASLSKYHAAIYSNSLELDCSSLLDRCSMVEDLRYHDQSYLEILSKIADNPTLLIWDIEEYFSDSQLSQVSFTKSLESYFDLDRTYAPVSPEYYRQKGQLIYFAKNHQFYDLSDHLDQSTKGESGPSRLIGAMAVEIGSDYQISYRSYAPQLGGLRSLDLITDCLSLVEDIVSQEEGAEITWVFEIEVDAVADALVHQLQGVSRLSVHSPQLQWGYCPFGSLLASFPEGSNQMNGILRCNVRGEVEVVTIQRC